MLGALILLPALGHFLLEKPSGATRSRSQAARGAGPSRSDAANAA